MRLLAAIALLLSPLAAADFARDIAPVFARHCSGCHGAKVQMNGFRLDDGTAALKGGYSGASILPGNASGSALIARITSSKENFMMPPAGPRLTPDQVKALRDWIDAGARFPANATANTNTNTNTNTKPTHWAFQSLAKPAAGATIDSLVRARLAKEKLAPAPEADKATLLRRASLDLTGLPPTLEEQQAFLRDTRPDAYERQIDRLLASPHYGERWARPWLDLARYADSDGFEKDLARAWSWRYRHWLIDALNADLPFDEFTLQHLAGDLIGKPIATGFHRMTLHNREAGVARAEDRFEQVINRTNTVSTTWLGLTAGCAQCHDHKYDPISQREYYQLFAFLNNAHDEQIDAPLPGELGPWIAAKPAYDAQRQKLLEEFNVPTLQAEFEKRLTTAINKPGDNVEWDFWVTSCTAMLDGCQKLFLTPVAQRTSQQARAATDYFIANVGPEYPRDKALMDKIKVLRGKLNDLNKTLPRYSQAYVLKEEPTKTFIAVRGDYKRPGIAVEPGTLNALPRFAPAAGEPARLAFAKWLVSPENPLTPRVIVNRAWQEFFGRGIVKTSEDFGTQGDRPTHPDLLDYLATEFQRDWSVKRLHRLIVTSATYKQSSAARPELKDRDADNSLLARQQRLRLPAELIRDSALSASGLLAPAIGGPSVKPPQPASVVELGYGKPSWNESTGPDRYRRGLYIHFQRTTPYPMLMTFDMPESSVACSRRRNSNTPLQSLNLLNDPVFFEAAQALALRLNDLGLEQGFALTLGRQPTAREKDRLASLIDSSAPAALSPANPTAAKWVNVARVLLNLDEFMTRE